MSKTIVTAGIAGIVGVIAGFLAAPSPETVVQTEVVEIGSHSGARFSRQRSSSSPGRALGGPAATYDADAGAAMPESMRGVDPRVRAARLVGSMLMRATDAEMVAEMNPDATTETAVNMVAEYQLGWIDAVTSDPSIDLGAIRTEVADQLCDRGRSEVERASLLQLNAHMPESATNRGIDCVLDDTREEGLMLWYAMDARANAALQPSPSMQRWAEEAADPRTLRRLDPYLGRDPDRLRVSAGEI